MLLTEFLGSQGAAWELRQAAPAVGLPSPPVVKLPALPPALTGCDLTALGTLLGPVAANALKTQLGSVGVTALLSNTLTEQKGRLLSYAAQVDAQIQAATAELVVLTGAQTTLGTAQNTLSELQALTGDATLQEIGVACPAAGYLLGMAGNALGTVNTGLTGAASLLTAAQGKLTALLSAKTLTDGLLAELDARLNALPGIAAVFSG